LTPGESVYAVKMAVFTARPRMIADLLALPGVRRHQISCRACNRLGVVVDVAHATEDTVKRAARDHPGSRPGRRRHGRLHRDLALLRDASSAGLFPDYDRFTILVDAMLRGGFTPADTAKIIGGNYLRIFAASVR
jgi:hypothetical protein